MEKKISVIIEEFKGSLVSVIQNSGLPVVIVDMILKDLYHEIHNLAIETTQKEVNEYKDFLKNQTEQDD